MQIKGYKCNDESFIEDIRNQVSYACSSLNRHKVTYFLDGGTLLGAMRERDILAHDYDGDIGYMWNMQETVLLALGTKFGNRGKIPLVDLLRYGTVSDDKTNTSIIARVLAAHEESDFFQSCNCARA